MKIAIIGYGYWGPNLVRNFANTPDCEVAYVLDQSSQQLQRVQKAYPNVKTTSNYDEILADNSVDAVAIATPVSAHYPLAKQALEHGKNVLIEKPMTSSVQAAESLIALAKTHGKVLMVDHTYLYTPAVQKMKALIDDGTLGSLQYIDSTRINLGLFQKDVNVLWDLAPHDISICNYLMEEKPLAVQAVGVSHTENNLENIAYLTLHYPNNKIAHFNCSWVSPVKIRQMLIGGDKKMIVFNDLETTEKLKIYDKGYTVLPESDRDKILVDYRTGDIRIPKLPQKEALGGMAQDFVNAIMQGTTPVSDFNSGLEVVAILEAASESILNKGKEVLIEPKYVA
ncbi:MAG: Gfo/Idh/MocA family protein [Saprospiraceae bacterium]